MISIIIPCKKVTDYLKETIDQILKLDYEDFEILVLPDNNYCHPERSRHSPAGEGGESKDPLYSDRLTLRDSSSRMLGIQNDKKIKIIPTGPVKAGQKRNLGAQQAQGEILAFLDDDAYPDKNWLANAIKYFSQSEVIAVGGPAVTPTSDSFWQKVSGAMFLSWLSGANPERYWPDKKVREVDDWPSVNLFVRKKIFLAVGGFDNHYWPGEDTKLCLDLVQQKNDSFVIPTKPKGRVEESLRPGQIDFKGSLDSVPSDGTPLGMTKKIKILYDPQVIVYHHRRKSLKEHLCQIGAYGYHRGLFAKKFPANSFKLKYFLPSLFFLFVIFGWLLLFLPAPFNLIYLYLWLIYILSLLIAIIEITLKIKNIFVALASVLYILPTHFWYGFRFIVGFLK